MNKLVIVGNGFDLAHGLPTSYKHFIDDFWKNLFQNYRHEKFKNLVYIDDGFLTFQIASEISNYDDFSGHGTRYISWFKDVYQKQRFFNTKNHGGQHDIFYFRSEFLETISTKNSIENWVDIENEYYLRLKQVVKNDNWGDLTKKENVQKLNEEFEQIKNLFEEYLIKDIAEVYDFTKFVGRSWVKLYDILKPISLFNNESRLLEEFLLQEDIEEIEVLFEIEKTKGERKANTYVLNFNYTFTIDQYIYEMYKNSNYWEKIIHIHGNLEKNKNPINFGFGDEMDVDYKLIEDLNDNEYLQNFKSFKYSQNSNYQNLLRIIESEKFQVYILGHSCGLSDRTLLNAIFEHENCRSIKVFYHERDGKNGEEDNFTEIVQNISRHFNDKKLMRSKIVNKSLCDPLPQDIRFQEKKNA